MTQEIPIDCDIPCARLSIIEPPRCDCWERLMCEQANQPAWLKPLHWAPGLFAGSPTESVNKARVCANTGRVVHVMSGDHYIDLILIGDHPADPTKTPMFMQYGYCFKCRCLEWYRYCSSQPTTPVIWFSCRN